jgi:hypothetical protein
MYYFFRLPLRLYLLLIHTLNNLIQFIPQICQQWITMVTDTELTEKEWDVYRNASCNCSFYKLNSQPDGTTRINKVPLDSVTQAIM